MAERATLPEWNPLPNKSYSFQKLSPKHQRFVLAYIKLKDPRKACAAAGYSKKSVNVEAYRLLENVRIKFAIDEILREIADAAKVDASWVLTRMKMVAERCLQEVPVYQKDSNGKLKKVGVWQFDANGANQSLIALGKTLTGFFAAEKKELSGPGGGPIQLNTTIDLSKVSTKILEKLANAIIE